VPVPADSILEARAFIFVRITPDQLCVGDDILGVPLYQYPNITTKKALHTECLIFFV